ncbi:hypothetical protein ACH427_16235 [Streptomyces sp. NPDC020379]|uniref:hypothetical protein n=1 Tax=Streptomyces sp. NPDC020379 TaxID=3365071 RepID=UPI00378A021C
MSNTVYPRRFLVATHDVKEAWSRALINEFGPGGLIAEQAPKFQRQHLLWALVLLRHVNGRDGMTFIGDAKVAELLGYNTKDVPGKQARDTLTRLVFFTQQGKQGRAARLRLSFPVALEGKYEGLEDAVIGETLTTADTKPGNPRQATKEAGPVPSEPKREPAAPAPPQVKADRCPVHPDGDCPDPGNPFGNDPFSAASPWDLQNCRRNRLAQGPWGPHSPAGAGTKL